MKASKGQIDRIVDRPGAEVRFYLFWGPDEGQSRALAKRLLQAMGADRFIVISNAVKNDPAALADEAGAMALFGGRRLIWLEPAGDEIAAGIEALLAAPATESPVVAIAPAGARPTALVKLAERSAAAVAFASYAPEGRDSARRVIDLGRRVGLNLGDAVAGQLAEACGHDHAVVAQELDKLALYLDASPHRPRTLDTDALEAVGANRESGDVLHLADRALAGEVRTLAELLGEVSGGAEAIPVVRALQRRLLQLAPARARIDAGERPDAVMTSLGKSLFWKDKELFAEMLRRWTSADLEQLSERTAALERQLLFSAAPEVGALGEELLAIGRAGRRR
jgi:DNA polymerase-3 subunit delta